MGDQMLTNKERYEKYKENYRKYYETHKEQRKAYLRTHREKYNEYNRRWRANNTNRKSQQNKNWRINNPEKYLVHTIISNNPEKYPLDNKCVFCGVTSKLERAHLDYEDKGYNYVTACHLCNVWMGKKANNIGEFCLDLKKELEQK